MSLHRSFSLVLGSTLLFAATSAPAGAHGDADEARTLRKTQNAERAGLSVSVGSGLGNTYSVLGVNASAELRSQSGLGVSASTGLGPFASWSLQAWSPGAKLRAGLGMSVGYEWSEFAGEGDRPVAYCVTVAERSHHGQARDPADPSVFGLDLLVDHDVGASRGWKMRYGLGSTVVAAGCAGAVLPMPSVGVSYNF